MIKAVREECTEKLLDWKGKRWFPSGDNLKGFLKDVAGKNNKDLDQWNLEQEFSRPWDAWAKALRPRESRLQTDSRSIWPCMKGTREMRREMRSNVFWWGKNLNARQRNFVAMTVYILQPVIGVPMWWLLLRQSSGLSSRRLLYHKALTFPISVQCHSMQICYLSTEDVKDTGTCCFTKYLQKSQSEQHCTMAPIPSLSLSNQEKIPDCSGICCPLPSSLFYSSGQKKRPEWKFSYLKWVEEGRREKNIF